MDNNKTDRIKNSAQYKEQWPEANTTSLNQTLETGLNGQKYERKLE